MIIDNLEELIRLDKRKSTPLRSRLPTSNREGHRTAGSSAGSCSLRGWKVAGVEAQAQSCRSGIWTNLLERIGRSQSELKQRMRFAERRVRPRTN